jgi:hypothetical protein
MRGSLGSSVYHSHGDGSEYIVEVDHYNSGLHNSGYNSPKNNNLLSVLPQNGFRKSPFTDFGD